MISTAAALIAGFAHRRKFAKVFFWTFSKFWSRMVVHRSFLKPRIVLLNSFFYEMLKRVFFQNLGGEKDEKSARKSNATGQGLRQKARMNKCPLTKRPEPERSRVALTYDEVNSSAHSNGPFRAWR